MKVGNEINHTTFGKGKITKMTNQIITIDFKEHGITDIARSWFEGEKVINDPYNFADFLQDRDVNIDMDDLRMIAAMWDSYKEEYITFCEDNEVEYEDVGEFIR